MHGAVVRLHGERHLVVEEALQHDERTAPRPVRGACRRRARCRAAPSRPAARGTHAAPGPPRRSVGALRSLVAVTSRPRTARASARPPPQRAARRRSSAVAACARNASMRSVSGWSAATAASGAGRSSACWRLAHHHRVAAVVTRGEFGDGDLREVGRGAGPPAPPRAPSAGPRTARVSPERRTSRGTSWRGRRWQDVAAAMAGSVAVHGSCGSPSFGRARLD